MKKTKIFSILLIVLLVASAVLATLGILSLTTDLKLFRLDLQSKENGSYSVEKLPAGAVRDRNGNICYYLTTRVTPSEGGMCTSYSGSFIPEGQEITVTAIASDGYNFYGWYEGEELRTLGSIFSFKMPSRACSLTAVFLREGSTDTPIIVPVDSYTLTTKSNAPEGGTFTEHISTPKKRGESVTLVASPADGYSFVGWYEGTNRVSSSAEYIFTMPSRDVTYTATFERASGWLLSTTTNDEEGGTYSAYYEISVKSGLPVTLTATANDNYTFAGWYDGDTLLSSSSTYRFSMPLKDVTYEARFVTYTLTTESNLESAGSFTKYQTTKCRAGNRLTLSASPYFGYLWLGWYNGDTLLTANASYTFSMPSESVTYTARFKKCDHTNLNGCLCADCGAAVHDYVDNVCTRCASTLWQRVDAEGDPAEDGNYLLFGSYLQSKVTETATTNALSSRAGLLPMSGESYAWTYDSSRGYYYIDVYYSGANYRGIYKNSVVSWFKYEPIKWRILSEEDGTAMILAESILDAHRYDDNSNNYAESEIRDWLNGEFLNRAFAEAQRSLILTTTVDNSVSSTGYDSNPYVCENTEDKVFLLSYAEVTNSAYGFSDDSARQKKTTAYAQMQGAYTSTESSYYGNGHWWLRSPYYDYKDYARYVYDYGYAGSNNDVYSNYGVVPALKINLQ